jgi:recombination associated protein RdgC
MWFRNLQSYRFSADFGFSPEQLEERLAERAFRPCGKLEPAAGGWLPPVPDGGALVHTASGYLMICLGMEERLLPASVVREHLDEKVAEIEQAEGNKVSRKRRLEMREELTLQLLPQAFTRRRRTYALIAPREGWLVVDASSAKRAEELTVVLRESLDSLPIAPPRVTKSPAAVMSGWLAGATPANLVVEDECELRDRSDEGGIIRCRRQDLASGEIQALLNADMEVTRLALTYAGRMGFILTESLEVKRLKFLDLVQEQAAGTEAETAAERFDADFAIMAPEVVGLLDRMLEWFGGEEAAGV